MSILDKKQMTEEDIKFNFITPAIKAKGWDGKITMGTKITDGRINLKGKIASGEAPKKADYILYLNSANPLLRAILICIPKAANFGGFTYRKNLKLKRKRG